MRFFCVCRPPRQECSFRRILGEIFEIRCRISQSVFRPSQTLSGFLQTTGTFLAMHFFFRRFRRIHGDKAVLIFEATSSASVNAQIGRQNVSPERARARKFSSASFLVSGNLAKKGSAESGRS